MNGYEKNYSPNLSEKSKQNSLRHMYIESKVANPDYFYLNKVNLDCLQNTNERNVSLYQCVWLSKSILILYHLKVVHNLVYVSIVNSQN